eukprot:CAMPEP_0172503128 /NCGR_PEP_ID=MMETSP1066-20121228/166406_1 /TAXON_ID=671091 /ORGANISM="Coscinodiscus wailesii, Strain CCMP2513" /LENGTH=695 /DNA_ID=CAMNT_0013278733 /DNA_START=385 /DNA_END=2472 /DNA_ORIENTATION=-
MSTNTYSNAATTATTEDASFDNIVTSPITTPRRQLSSSSSTTTVTTTTDGNRNDTTTTASSTTSSPAPAKTINRRTTSCDDTTKASNNYILTLYILGVIYMFLALAIVCDEFFVPALEEMSSERHLNLSMDVAGATLMAAGGSAPELFTSLVGTMNESAIGFGTIVGSAVFNVLFVIAMCSFFSTTVLNLTWWPLARDSVYYVVSLGVLGYFVGYATPGYVEWWESAILFGMYVGYVIVMAYNRQLYQLLTGKAYVDPEEGPASDGAALGGSNLEEQLTAADGDRPSPQRDALNNYTHGRWPGTFRAGIIKLLREPESWKATAGLGIVARIAGDVNVTFRHIDANCNGTIDKEELKLVFKDLGEELTPDELDAAFQHLDKNGDGKISEKEFTEYYIRSQTKLRAKVKEVFDTFDINHNGKIERSELITLLTILEPATTTKDIDRAMAQLNAGKTDNDVDITLDDFSEWYTSSILFEKKVAAVKSDMDGAFDHLKPPSGPDTTCVSYLVYVIYLPLLVTLTFTVPDVRKPGWGRWCYAAFLLSIVWIGVYSYFMVGWATIIGSTVGIPDVVMGLTFLAAGTSVPDLLSSVIVARRGEGDMAVSSSLGSNIFDILVGLPVPWLIYSALRSHSVTVGADGVALSIFILVVMVILVIATINFCGWKLSKTVGGIMVLLYLVFLAQAVIRELPFQTCTDE